MNIKVYFGAYFNYSFMRIVMCLFLSALILLSCKPEVEGPQLTVDQSAISFFSNGGTITVEVKMNGKNWAASVDKSWCILSRTDASTSIARINILAKTNSEHQLRTATLTILMDGKTTATVNITQTTEPEHIYPIYSRWKASETTGMPNEALKIASSMSVGWNLGNSLEVPSDETAWGNAKTTQTLIDSVKKAGFNAIRIPCAWDSYVENRLTFKIKPSWLNRVKEVVDYAIANEMYIILNIHWDGGWLENNPRYSGQSVINAKQKAIWEQIAMHFREYDEHLLFAGTNEVHVDGTPTDENFEVQMSFNQTFVDAVRSTGGKNSYRNLVVQAYNTNIDFADANLVLPSDTVANRLMAEVHYYDPWDFCGLEADASWATAKFLWGNAFAAYGEISPWGQEDHVQSQFQKMKLKFVDHGCPVILGEFGAIKRTSANPTLLEHHLASRSYFFEYITREAKNHGLVPFFWDNGSGFFNRSSSAVSDTRALKALMKGAGDGIYPY
jgi:endoglucanase